MRGVAAPATLSALALLLVADACRADAQLSYRRTGEPCATDFQALHVKGSRLRLDTDGPWGKGSMLYDGVEQYMQYLDHEGRTVAPMELDDDALDFQADVMSASATRLDKEMEKARAEYAKAKEQMAAQCKQMERQGMACPRMPDFDAMMEPGGMGAMFDAEAMQGMLAQQQEALAQVDPRQLEKMGIDPKQLAAQQQQTQELMAHVGAQQGTTIAANLGRREVNGIACETWERRREDVVLERGCIATLESVGLSPRDLRGLDAAWKRMMKMSETVEPMTHRFGDLVPEQPPRFGVDLQRSCYADGKVTGESTLQIKETSLPESLFEVPAGYGSILRQGRSEG